MKKILSIISIFAISLLLISCQGKVADYEFTNPEFPSNGNNSTIDKDESIIFDGKLDESLYDDIEALSFVSSLDQDQEMSVQVHFADKGLLIGVDRKDDSLYIDNTKPVWQNDAVEFYINPTENKNNLTKDFVQLRIAVDGTVESWIGIMSPDGYPWTFYVLEFDVAVHAKSTIIDDYELDTEANRKSEGFTMEIFIPWDVLSLDEKPSTIDLFPSFVNRRSLAEGDFNWNGYGPNHENPSGYITFNSKGPGSLEGTVFGDSQIGVYSTSGFDLSDDANEVWQKGGGDQVTFFKEIYDTKYGFEITIDSMKALNNDAFPKFGVLVGEEENRKNVFLLDPLPGFTQKEGIFVPRVKENDNWLDWNWNPGTSLSKDFSYEESIKLTVLRDETYAYMFVNDEFLMKRVHNYKGKTQPGLFTMNMEARYTNPEILDEARIDELISQNNAVENSHYKNGTTGFELDGKNAIQTGTRDQYINFRDVSGELYGFSIDLSTFKTLNGDAHPKMGVIVGNNETDIMTLLIDPFANFTNYYSLFVQGKKLDTGNWGDWNWPQAGIQLPDGTSFDESINIQILRDSTYMYLYINEVFIKKEFHGFTGSTQAGLFTMNMETTFNNLEVFSNEKVTSMINSLSEGEQDNELFDNVSQGYDVTDESNLIQSNSGDQYAFFKNIHSKKYIASTNVLIGNNLAGDEFPKIGMIAGKNIDGEVAFFFDPRPKQDVKDALTVNKVGGEWKWPGKTIWLDNLNFENEIKMTVVRVDSTIYMFIDDVLIHKIDNIILKEDSQPGIITMNHSGSFNNSFASADNKIVDTYLNNYVFSADKNFGWEGYGNFNILDSNNINVGNNKHETNYESNKIVNKNLKLDGDFTLTYNVKNLKYAPMEWVWPKLSILLVKDDNSSMTIGVGANVNKQYRLEADIDGWGNYEKFNDVDFEEGFEVKIERVIVGDKSQIKIYVNDILQKTDDLKEFRESNYIGDFILGLQCDYASGSISNIKIN